MSVYTIAGEEIFAVYDAEGAGLSQAYDIDTNPLLGDDAISGRIITFDSNGTLPKSLTLSLSPTQAGSGTPSSSNIRKLSGYTSVTVTRTGKNLWGGEEILRSVVAAKLPGASANYTAMTAYFQSTGLRGLPALFSTFKEDTRYTLDITAQHSVSTSNICFYYTDEDYGGIGADGSKTKHRSLWVSKEGGSLISISGIWRNGNTTIYANETGLFEGVLTHEECAPYIPYQGETYTISFPSEAGTVYGAEIDLLKETLTVTMGYIASYAGEELPGAWASDRDVYVEGTAPTTGAQVVYRLATPVTYSLDEIGFTTLDGENNVWGNHGELAVKPGAASTTSTPLLGGLLGGGLLGSSNAALPEDLFDPIVCEDEPPEPPDWIDLNEAMEYDPDSEEATE